MVPGIFLGAVRVLWHRVSPLKLVVLGGALFLTMLLMIHKDVGGRASVPDPWFLEPTREKELVMGVVIGAVGNPSFQIGAPPPLPADLQESNHCSPGFYSAAELRPRMERPSQDPKSPGANGQAFPTNQLSADEVNEKMEGMNRHHFNQFASDRISLHRSLGADTRHPDCVGHKFRRCPPLPSTSVIIIFHNEAWSTLLRTVYSVLHTAPSAFLTEILLVDDASTAEHLKDRLEKYVRTLKIVRILRQPVREGLVSARLLGAREARGEVLTFLDSHCECFHGWLEPLLARIREEPTAVVSPEIVTITSDSLQFNKPVATSRVRKRGNFDWSLIFGWESVPEQERKNRKNETYPVKTPVFAGGLFSISKSYFQHIGTYDDQMEIWGGENLEMSFRGSHLVWLCGGRLEIIPCSVVGHIFRSKTPHTFPKGTKVITRNKVRLAEVWMDEYKQIFYRSNPEAAAIARENNYGDVSERLKIRERLHCKNFSWYLTNIYPETFIPDLIPLKFGAVENAVSNTCLDMGQDKTGGKPLIMYMCHNMGGNQYFEYTSHKELRGIMRRNQLCVHSSQGPEPVKAQFCKLKGPGTSVDPAQQWEITGHQLFKNPSSGKCLSLHGNQILMDICNSADPKQHWAFR